MLSTPRLHLRELETKDIEPVHELLSLPETDEYNTLGIPQNIAQTEGWFNEWSSGQHQQPRSSYVFTIDLKEEDKLIGLIAITLGKEKFKAAEVWFKLHKDYWGRGYTSEAFMQVLHFGFNHLQLHRIEAGCAVGNKASARVLEKAGMLREGTKRKRLPIRGQWSDSYFYAILEEDFKDKISS